MFIYTGIQNLPANFDYDSFLEYDVILMSYSILAKEVHYAIPPPKRSMRYQKIHVPRRSPLMEFSWWRVCLDEAQMIEGSVTAAATVACMLSRSVSSPSTLIDQINLTIRMLGVYLGHPAKRTYLTSMDCLFSCGISPSPIIHRYGIGYVMIGIRSSVFSVPSCAVTRNIMLKTKWLYLLKQKRFCR